MTHEELFEKLFLTKSMSINIHTNMFTFFGDSYSVSLATNYEKCLDFMFDNGSHLIIEKCDITKISTIEDDGDGEDDIKVELKDGAYIVFFDLITAAN